MSPTIEEAKKEKEVLEVKIRNLLNEFTKKYGMLVTDINLESHFIMTEEVQKVIGVNISLDI